MKPMKPMSRSKADGALLFRTVYSVFIKTGIVWASSEMNSTSPSWLAVSVTRMRPVNIFLILSVLAIFICSTTLNISWSLSLSSVHRMAEKIYQTIAVFNSSIEQNIKKIYKFISIRLVLVSLILEHWLHIIWKMTNTGMFYKCKKNNWSLERKGAYKNIFRVKQRQTIFYFSESQKPLLYVPKRSRSSLFPLNVDVT